MAATRNLKHGMTGLVLTAGGSRGAYQAGVLKRMGEIPHLKDRPSPFPIIAGASAGAINGAFLAAFSDHFTTAGSKMAELWADIKTEQVFKTDALAMTGLLGQWMKDLLLGKYFGGGKVQSLLDATPLLGLLGKYLPLGNIRKRIDSGDLYAIAITASNYYNGISYTFIEGKSGHPTWQKSRRVAIPAELTIQHICASSAIPIIFQPVLVGTPMGDYYFGDGGLRLTAPLSPAIRLGAQRVFGIGIRSQIGAEERWKKDLLTSQENRIRMRKPPMSQMIGVILNSIFLDHLDSDAEHLARINEIIKTHHEDKTPGHEMREPIKPLHCMVVNPSVDLGQVAEQYVKKIPGVMRHFLEGLGSSQSESADLASYLLFENAYTRDLIDLGYKDTTHIIDEIEAFLLA